MTVKGGVVDSDDLQRVHFDGDELARVVRDAFNEASGGMVAPFERLDPGTLAAFERVGVRVLEHVLAKAGARVAVLDKAGRA